MKKEYGLVSMVLAGVLAGCGGGGGGGGGGGTSPNSPPTVAAQGFTATEDTAFSGTVAATDPGDTLTYSVASNPANGSLTSFTAAGAFTYQPSANFSGTDTFTVRVTDSANQAATATMTMNVGAVNDAPTANDDRFAVTAADSFNVLANDSDVETTALAVSIVGTSFPAGATVGSDGRVSFPVAADFKGLVKFRYRITDAGGATAEANAVGFVNIVPFKAVFIGRPAGAALTGNRVYVNDFLRTYPADDDPGAPQELVVASNGNQLAYRIATSGGGTQVFAVNLAQPQTVHPVSAALAAGVAVDAMKFTPDGRFLVYSSGDASGTAIYRYDTQAPATPAARISPAATDLQFATAPRFNPAGTEVYYGGRAPAAGSSACYRTNLASATTTRVCALQAGSQFGVGVDFVWPTPDESKVISHFLEEGAIPGYEHFTVQVSPTAAPNISQLAHIPAPLAVSFAIPMVAPDGISILLNGPTVLSVGRSDQANTETFVGPASFVLQRLQEVPDRERVMRTDSQAALVVSGCGDQVNFPNLPCDVYELTFANPTTPVRVHPANAAGFDSRDPAYSHDGARIVFRHVSPTAPGRLAVVRRGGFDSQQFVSADGDFVVRYVLDFSGYTAAYTSVVTGQVGHSLSLANLDVPGQSLDIGIAGDGTRYFLVAY